ncbi:MAG: 3-hydroxyacyl-CoA dehydrogenase/enoyl-CoA hydratase family protein [Candidatus Berkiellales bacterium]
MDPTQKLSIRRAAVLGAGVMGAQIAAHLVNAGVETVLFDLPSEKDNPNAVVEHAILALKKLKPTPLGVDGIEKLIVPANYNTDVAKLKDCDLIIEAIAERMDWKQNLYAKIIPFINEHAIFATNTSGLSIKQLGETLPQTLRQRFCAIHFFNPPRYMKLIEIISHPEMDPILLNHLETFLVSRLGKGVIHAKDTPNFIGNRIGVFAFLSTIHHAQELGLAPDLVDALTGPLMGRPKSATFRTMDVVGLDTMAHVIHTLSGSLKDDPWKSYFVIPDWITKLIERGSLGQKTQAGIYKKEGKQILVYDFYDQHYRPLQAHVEQEVLAILNQKNVEERFKALNQSHHAQAQFLWRIFRDLFHYCGYHLQGIANTARELDLAMRWGYGWAQGPFETWQSAGWQSLTHLIENEIHLGLTMSSQPLPEWVKDKKFNGPYQMGKAFSPNAKTFEPRSELPVYRRQLFPERLLTDPQEEGETIFETSAIRLWKLNDNIPILSFKTKRNSITLEALEGFQEAIQRAEKDFDALVIWQRDNADFSVGANLNQIVDALSQRRMDFIEKAVHAFQNTAMAVRYATIPIVAALRGLTLGGGCEISMHAAKRVATFETYMGLVEVGIGLLPGGSGCTELALRAARKATDGDIFQPLKQYFKQITTAQVSTSALDATKLNYLTAADHIVMNPDELLFVAKKHAKALADECYHPPLKPKFPVVGSTGIANFQTALVNLRQGEFISDFDFMLGSKIANILCGGPLEMGSLVDEDWILNLEREGLFALLETPQTFDRIKYMLEQGKPLRN